MRISVTHVHIGKTAARQLQSIAIGPCRRRNIIQIPNAPANRCSICRWGIFITGCFTAYWAVWADLCCHASPCASRSAGFATTKRRAWSTPGGNPELPPQVASGVRCRIQGSYVLSSWCVCSADCAALLPMDYC